MGPASSAQREPSMEEILASIRRIIEDSDSARSPHPETHTDTTEERPEGAVIEVDAFRAELRGRGDQPERAPAPAEADVVVRPSAAAAAPTPAAPQPAPAAPAAPTAPAGSAEPDFDVGIDAGFDRAFETIRAATGAADRTAAAAPAVPAIETGRPTIISERTGRQVAAAFGELSEAFAASRRRSFDEIAEEMMRPMLQDWLDNNLPTLVERLVREEIERIARGG